MEGGRCFKKTREFAGRLGLHRTRTSPYPLARGLQVCKEALTRLGHRYCPRDLNNAVRSQACVLESGPTAGTVGRTRSPRPGCGAPDSLGRTCGSTGGHGLPLTSSNGKSKGFSHCARNGKKTKYFLLYVTTSQAAFW